MLMSFVVMFSKVLSIYFCPCLYTPYTQWCLKCSSEGIKYERLETTSEAKSLSRKGIHCLKIIFLFFILVVIFVLFFLTGISKKAKLSTPQPFGPSKPKVCSVPEKNGPLIKVGDLKTYVIGSYMEHRSTPKLMKTIAIVFRMQDVTYSCVACCEGRNVSSPAQLSIHSDHFGFEYGTAEITCQIDPTCSTPTHVAITADKLSGSITSYQPLANRDIPKSFTYNFTICISVMYEYKNVLNLVQAMEMFKLLGVQKVAIYKSSCDSDTQKALDYYVQSGFLDVIPWTVADYIKVSKGWQKNTSPGELHYYGQIPALNDCVQRYMYQSKYVALQDLDELILPLKVKTWTELFSELEKRHGTDVGFEFENNVFPFSKKSETYYDQNDWKNVQGTNILNYVDRIPNNPHEFNNYKVIVNPRLVFAATVHGLLYHSTVRVDNTIARIYHSKKFTYPENTHLIKDKRLWDYADDLIREVSKVLRDCGFIKS